MAGRPLRNQLTAAATELASDGSEIAAAILEHALAPLGAAAVALWLIAPDGGLDLLGEAGLGATEASRWRRIPPQMGCPAQQVAREGRDLWWPGAGRAPGGPGGPLIGRWPGGARAVLALRDRAAIPLGVMEVCWPQARDGFPDALRQQAGDLAGACAELLSTGLAPGGAVAGSRPAVPGLLGGLLETVMIATALRDGDGTVIDFRIEHAAGQDPAGRAAAELTGRTLLEAYPRPRRPAACWSTRCARSPPARPSSLTGPAGEPGVRWPASGSPVSSTGSRSPGGAGEAAGSRRSSSRSSGSAGSAPGRRT